MPPCLGSAASAAPDIADKASIATANARTHRMLLSLSSFDLVPLCICRPIGRDDSHGRTARQPAKPLVALAIWMKYLRHRRDRMCRRQLSRVEIRQRFAFAPLRGQFMTCAADGLSALYCGASTIGST